MFERDFTYMCDEIFAGVDWGMSNQVKRVQMGSNEFHYVPI